MNKYSMWLKIISAVLFVLYFILISIPQLDTSDNRLFLKILSILPYVLIMISYYPFKSKNHNQEKGNQN